MENLETVIQDSKIVLEDVMLSGFQNIHPELLKEMERLEKVYEDYGMYQGKKLLHHFYVELRQNKNSAKDMKEKLVASFGQLEFYLSCL